MSGNPSTLPLPRSERRESFPFRSNIEVPSPMRTSRRVAVSLRKPYAHSWKSPFARGSLALALACAAVLTRHSANAATLFWDGTGTGWDNVGSWSEVDVDSV